MRNLLLLAFLGLILTQAIIAKDVAEEENDDELSLAERLYRGMTDLFGSYEEDETEASRDLKNILDTELDETKLTLEDNKYLDELEDSMKPSFGKAKIKDIVEQQKANIPGAVPPTPVKKASKEKPKYQPRGTRSDSEKRRKVKSFNMGPNGQLKYTDESEESHRRVKRSHIGAGIPDDFEFTLEATGAFASTSNFKIGSIIPYILTIHANDVETDVKIEIFSEMSGGAYFMVSKVRLGDVGSNFGDFNESTAVVRYHARFNDGRWDYATIDLGSILNSATNKDDPDESKIQVLFEMQALPHSNLQVGSSYQVSVGAMYQSESFISVSQDDLTYELYTEQPKMDAIFEISGPDSLNLGITGVWTIKATIYDLYSEIALDVLAPIHEPGAMAIDSISIIDVGEHFKNSAVGFDDGANFTKLTFENYGNYGRLDLGTIINGGYHDADADGPKSTITFEVAITMLDHEYNATGYTVGFTVWKKDMSNIEIMWSAQQELAAVNETLPALPSSPSFDLRTNADKVYRDGGIFSVILNMSTPLESSAVYVLEASIPMTNNTNKATMNIESVRIYRVGHNMPHIAQMSHVPTEDDLVQDKTDGVNVDFISWNLGIITNTGQRAGDDDSIIQFELRLKMLPESADDYASGDSIPISVGMRHAEDYYWVGRTQFEVTDSPIEYSGAQVPEFSFVNAMGSDAKIYPGSAAVYDLDMIVPAGVDYTNLFLEASTLPDTLDTDTAPIRIISTEVVSTGRALFVEEGITYNFTDYTGPAVDESERPIYTVVTVSIPRITNLKYENVYRYDDVDARVRFRITVVAREAGFLTDAEVYWTEVTVDFATYIYAGRAGVECSLTRPDFYANVANEVEKWQPVQRLELREGQESSVQYGQPVFYNATIAVPYRTVTSALVQIKSSTPELQICRVKFLNAGGALVDFQRYDPHLIKGDVVNRTTEAERDITSNYKDAVSSYSYNYYVDDVMDSYLYYEAVVMLNERAGIGSSYTFDAVMKAQNVETSFTPSVTAINATASGVEGLPAINIGKLTEQTDTINLGGSEIFYLDLYISPGTQHNYVVNVFAPWNSTFYGQYELLEVYIVSAGENLACYDYYFTNITVNTSSDNDTPFNNLGVVHLGYIPSLAEIGTEVKLDENKLRIMAHVGVLSNSTELVGESIPVAGTVDIGGNHLWVGYVDAEVLPAASDDNDIDNNQTAELYITNRGGDSVFSVGEVQHYTARVVLPAGESFADFALNLESQVDDDESRIKIFDVVYDDAGKNLLELGKYHEIIPTPNPYGIDHIQKVDFKFARNTDLSGVSDYISPKTERETAAAVLDNEISFNFSVKLLDTINFVNGYKFNLNATVTAGSGLLAEGAGDIEITVETLEDDNAIILWDVGIVSTPPSITRDTILEFYLNMSLSEDSKRFPSQVSLNFRLPYFNQLKGFSNESVITSQYTAPTKVNDYGLRFVWSKIRWEHTNYMHFTVELDPTSEMEPGLEDRKITIPVDISYEREDRDNPGSSDDWYTEMKVITFDINVPESYEALGMENGDILDCQITASSYEAPAEPSKARPNLDGWSVGEGRGEPLYQNEYIQVDMSGKVKFTGVTIYPYNDVGVSRVTKFMVQYSSKGIRWMYALDGSLEPRVFDVAWPVSPTTSSSVLVQFDESEFIAEHVRIIPQENAESSYTSKLRFELHGYAYPYKSTLTAYSCPAAGPVLKGYDDRQLLAVPNKEEMYACTIPRPGLLPFCSATDDMGVSWFAMDDNVLNVYGYDTETAYVYALARDRKTCLRSQDSGHRWKAINCARHDAVVSAGTYVPAKAVPFNLAGKTATDLVNDYGTDVDAGHFWTVSEKAVHAYLNSGSGDAGTKVDTDGQVAYWGNKVWAGP